MVQNNDRPEAGADLVASREGWLQWHRELYLTNPREAHWSDLRDMGGYQFNAQMLLKTIGRKSGKTYLNPLGYFLYGPWVIIAASKGGHPEHPSWYLNLREMKDVTFQIREDCFIGAWHLIEGAERAKVWEYLEVMYPPFEDYKNATTREIPVIALEWRERVDSL